MTDYLHTFDEKMTFEKMTLGLARFHRLGHPDVTTEYDAGCPYCNPQPIEMGPVDTSGVNANRFKGLEA